MQWRVNSARVALNSEHITEHRLFTDVMAGHLSVEHTILQCRAVRRNDRALYPAATSELNILYCYTILTRVQCTTLASTFTVVCHCQCHCLHNVVGARTTG